MAKKREAQNVESSRESCGQKNPVGRPTDYDPNLCEIVVALGREGKSLTQISACIDIARSTLYEWRDTHKEFSDAITRAQELAQAWWEDKGQEGLLFPGFNASLWAKQVSCRFAEEYRENKQDIELSGKNGGAIKTESRLDVGGLSDEQLKALASIKLPQE